MIRVAYRWFRCYVLGVHYWGTRGKDFLCENCGAMNL